MSIFRKITNSLKQQGLKKFIKILFNKIWIYLRFLINSKKKINPDEVTFQLHSQLIDKIYGGGADIAVGKISNKLLEVLKSEFCSDSSFHDTTEIINSQNIHPILKTDINSKYILENLKKNIVAGNLHIYNSENLTLKKLHDELRQMFRVHIGSPFIFVNTRIWKTKPNSKNFGPNDWHTDNFFPGHRKIMVYLTPLNEDYGVFEYKNSKYNIHTIKNEPAGTTIFFRNSDILHQGVPGKTYDRISIEVTLMRSMVNEEQKWQGHFFGRHFKNLRQLESVFNINKL